MQQMAMYLETEGQVLIFTTATELVTVC